MRGRAQQGLASSRRNVYILQTFRLLLTEWSPEPGGDRMARTAKDVTDAELAVLEVLWRRGESSIREIADELYPGGASSELATVQKLCERLVAKSFVARHRGRRPQLFAAAVDRQQLIGRQLKLVADKLCAGSYTPLLNHLVEGSALTAEEIGALRDLVQRLDQGEVTPKSARPNRPRGRR